MNRNFVVSAEIVEVGVRLPTKVEGLPCERTAAWDEHFKMRQYYSKALEAWYQSEIIVIRKSQLAASACDDSAEYTSKTAHHVRESLAHAVVGKIGIPGLCGV